MADDTGSAPVENQEAAELKVEAPKVHCRDCKHFVTGDRALRLLKPKLKKFGRKHAVEKLRQHIRNGCGTCVGGGLNAKGEPVDTGHGNLTFPGYGCVKGEPKE
jgi:hypothetical protein